jgi:hypothetical protein
VGARRGTYPPANYSDFAYFAARLVRRYGPGGEFWQQHPELPQLPIRSWQVWNEPSLSVYWQPGPDPAAYTRLLRIVRAGIKSVDPRAEVVTAGIPYTQIRSAVPLARFLRQMYAAGGRSAFDTLAVNAYSKNAGELRRTLRKVRRVMRRYGDSRKKLWITEIGWATGGNASPLTVTPDVQAANVTRSYRLLAKTRKRLKLVGAIWYSWRDLPGLIWFNHTGLFDETGNPKPSWNAFVALTHGSPG